MSGSEDAVKGVERDITLGMAAGEERRRTEDKRFRLMASESLQASEIAGAEFAGHGAGLRWASRAAWAATCCSFKPVEAVRSVKFCGDCLPS